MPEILKEFLALLIAYAPSKEGLRNFYDYKEEYNRILNTDYISKKFTDKMIKRLAENKGIDVKIYKDAMNNKIREKDIIELGTKYGIIKDEDTENDPLKRLREKVSSYKESNEDKQSNDFISSLNFLQNK